jgi:hexosaminidase
MVDRIIAGKATTEDWDQAQEWLVLWRDNDVQLQPLLSRSDLTKELAPVSTNLHFVSQAGLDAIGYLREHHHAPPTWKTRQIEYLKKSEKPQAILLNMVAPAVLKLVQATP